MGAYPPIPHSMLMWSSMRTLYRAMCSMWFALSQWALLEAYGQGYVSLRVFSSVVALAAASRLGVRCVGQVSSQAETLVSCFFLASYSHWYNAIAGLASHAFSMSKTAVA